MVLNYYCDQAVSLMGGLGGLVQAIFILPNIWVFLYYYCDQAVSLMGGLGVGRCDSGWEPRIAEQDYQSFLGFRVFESLFFCLCLCLCLCAVWFV